MFNAFNRAMFDPPNNSVTSGSFGRITSTAGSGAGYEQGTFGYPARVMQAALKVYF
jgi:hypothetical protein